MSVKEHVTDAVTQSLTDETRALAREIIARYPEGRSRSALLPMLHLVQSVEGYVTPAGVAFCATELGLTKAEVGAVATFYTMYKRRPTGEYLVSVCTNLSCQILGGEEVFARLSNKLGIGHNQTTEDGTVTLEHAECLAACDYAPVATVNYEFFDNVTEESAEQIVDALLRGERPQPTRGAPLCSFREIEFQLAGFTDPRGASAVAGLVDGVAGAPAHPNAPHPVDVRGTESLAGTDVGPAPELATYAVPGGDTERVLSDADAAATYGEPATRDAGVPPEVGTRSDFATGDGGESAATAAATGATGGGEPSPAESGPSRGADQEADTALGSADVASPAGGPPPAGEKSGGGGSPDTAEGTPASAPTDDTTQATGTTTTAAASTGATAVAAGGSAPDADTAQGTAEGTSRIAPAGSGGQATRRRRRTTKAADTPAEPAADPAVDPSSDPASTTKES